MSDFETSCDTTDGRISGNEITRLGLPAIHLRATILQMGIVLGKDVILQSSTGALIQQAANLLKQLLGLVKHSPDFRLNRFGV
mmetsp:Transcript_11318/g.19332  ORF Transcript_11318/g.19332 Transcript_11318/m.19332 type:complete len:83 (-) Transcript_11318:179-427(-)